MQSFASILELEWLSETLHNATISFATESGSCSSQNNTRKAAASASA
jgi:hypothetical protein